MSLVPTQVTFEVTEKMPCARCTKIRWLNDAGVCGVCLYDERAAKAGSPSPPLAPVCDPRVAAALNPPMLELSEFPQTEGVYVLGDPDTELYKIGRSRCLQKRVQNLLSFPFPLRYRQWWETNDSAALENGAHRFMKGLRISENGVQTEWFRLSESALYSLEKYLNREVRRLNRTREPKP